MGVTQALVVIPPCGWYEVQVRTAPHGAGEIRSSRWSKSGVARFASFRGFAAECLNHCITCVAQEGRGGVKRLEGDEYFMYRVLVLKWA